DKRCSSFISRSSNVSPFLSFCDVCLCLPLFLRWEEEKCTDGSKWRFLEHKGPVCPPPYEPLHIIIMWSTGKAMKLSPGAEEVATFYNFFKDWRKEMTSEEKSKITELKKCDFTEMHEYFKAQSEARKQMSKEEKQVSVFNLTLFGIFIFHSLVRMKPFSTRSKTVMTVSVVLRDSVHPKAPPGTRWKEVRHDNKVTWLVSWTENIQGSIKYIMLNPSSRIKGEKDWQKYETARRLKKCVERIRAQYREDWRSKEMRIRQRAVALYFIDKLALRAGNEKDEGETADTVGCCSLRVEHIRLRPQMDGQDYVVELDFPGKDSIRYYNKVPVEKRIFKNLQLFLENKQGKDDLFDRLTKIFWYNRANRAVAVLCNHQRAPPKTFEKSMHNLQTKVQVIKITISNLNSGLLAVINKQKPIGITKKKAVQRISEQLMKLEVQATDREENKQIALGTSKLNYLDPRISVAWCKKWGVPIEKIYNKTQREKFAWAIDMTDEDFEF
uniref:DNA topoisomerase 1 n=1 Tax=Sinocyclocheilus rhinocerous TaxID=307959 RepID=A0A673LYE9_9TELE